ncbi:MAG TPA: GAF domain-containing protein [Terriglobales bacterium]|nr:GAF domain-containing protein [Terriglobales bacterium]
MATTVRVLYDEVPSTVATEAERFTKLEELAKKLLKTVEAVGVAIACRQSKLGALICIASAGKKVPPIGAFVNPNFGISGRCVRECRTQKSYDTLIDPRVDPLVCKKLGIRSVAVVPLLSGSQCIGLLEAFSNQPGHFDPQKVQAIEDAAVSAHLLLNGELENSATPISTAADLVATTEDPALPLASAEQAQSEPPVAIRCEAGSSSDRSRWHWAVPGLVLVALFLAGSFVHRRTRRERPMIRYSRQTSIVGSRGDTTGVSLVDSPDVGSVSVSRTQPKSPLLVFIRQGKGEEAQTGLAADYQKGKEVPRNSVKAAAR